MSGSQAITSYRQIQGWFFWQDRVLFDGLLNSQSETGDLVELGAYMGKSAVIIDNNLRAGERFVVVDLFGSDQGLAHAVDAASNKAELDASYKSLTRDQFEQNYLALQPELPVVVQDYSARVVDHVAPHAARFVHIDASHLYDEVRKDVEAARTILQPDGVIAFDDFRSAHTPGVSAAVWEAVVNDGLKAFAVTDHKLYATWGNGDRHREAVRETVSRFEKLFISVTPARGEDILRVRTVGNPAPAAPPAT